MQELLVETLEYRNGEWVVIKVTRYVNSNGEPFFCKDDEGREFVNQGVTAHA